MTHMGHFTPILTPNNYKIDDQKVLLFLLQKALVPSRVKMKQRIVFSVCMHCEKYRAKARSVVGKTYGIISLVIEGDDKMVVTGDEIDIPKLTKKLRKKVGHTSIYSVSVLDKN